ncbi:hypothetical protein QBC41DRAFT_314322 [Cercophora samala]|uniref:2EXR domain-containing protein n=1 Tax=Cercophora samala TaxID=330535 RepID=A0AA39ZJE8_9PEZI|nr:hypothetical protein QBC41DRAFT_314322 [Cercophora samala]
MPRRDEDDEDGGTGLYVSELAEDSLEEGNPFATHISHSDVDNDDDDDDDEQDSEDDSRFALIDDMAADSEDASDEDDKDDDDSEDSSGSDDDDSEEPQHKRPSKKHTQFIPQFIQLPLELQQLIWKQFCPDLTEKARFYEFQIVGQLVSQNGTPPEIWESVQLEQQTKAARTVLAVHHQSRKLALRYLPDELALRGGRGSVRFHSQRDVIFIDRVASAMSRHFPPWPMPVIPGVTDRIRNIAFEKGLFFLTGDPMLQSFTCAFPNLQHAFFLAKYNHCEAKNLLWCADPSANHYTMTCEEEAEIQHRRRGYETKNIIEYRWVWPNVEKRAADARRASVADARPTSAEEVNGVSNSTGPREADEEFLTITPEEIACYAADDMRGLDDSDSDSDSEEEEEPGTYVQRAWSLGFKVWPVVEFFESRGERAFQKLLQWNEDGVTDVAFDDEDYSDEGEEIPDEYESSGIDDSEIESGDSSDDSDDLNIVDVDNSDDSDGSNEDDSEDEEEGGGSAVYSEGEEVDGDRPLIDLTGSDGNEHEEEVFAGFSSPEPESVTLRASSSVEEVSDAESDQPAARSRLKRRRNRVMESSDVEKNSDDDDDVPRPAKRARRVVDSDSDDEKDHFEEVDDDVAPRPIKRARRVVDSDSEDEGDDAEDDEMPQLLKRARRDSTALLVRPDDDTDQEVRKMRANKRLRAVVSDDSEDDEVDHNNVEESDEDQQESDSQSSDGSDGSDSEDVDNEQFSRSRKATSALAQKLGLTGGRGRVPMPPSDSEDDDDDDDEIERKRGDDYDVGNYEVFEDDDEDMEEVNRDGEDEEEIFGGDDYDEDREDY